MSILTNVSSFFKGLISDLPIIGKDVATVGEAIAPVVNIWNPALGAILLGVSGKVISAVTSAEQASPTPSSGATKMVMANSDIQSAIDMANEILALDGKVVTVDPLLITAAINATVAAFNAMGALKAGYKISAVPPALGAK